MISFVLLNTGLMKLLQGSLKNSSDFHFSPMSSPASPKSSLPAPLSEAQLLQVRLSGSYRRSAPLHSSPRSLQQQPQLARAEGLLANRICFCFFTLVSSAVSPFPKTK
mmetsp:Transcript_1517/g.2658  ORF Transcript_1517/g.2658 Transcript_1517/m.2658 type:complete len:108 (+) Transcript_1517:2537-2860(+)